MVFSYIGMKKITNSDCKVNGSEHNSRLMLNSNHNRALKAIPDFRQAEELVNVHVQLLSGRHISYDLKINVSSGRIALNGAKQLFDDANIQAGDMFRIEAQVFGTVLVMYFTEVGDDNFSDDSAATAVVAPPAKATGKRARQPTTDSAGEGPRKARRGSGSSSVGSNSPTASPDLAGLPFSVPATASGAPTSGPAVAAVPLPFPFSSTPPTDSAPSGSPEETAHPNRRRSSRTTAGQHSLHQKRSREEAYGDDEELELENIQPNRSYKRVRRSAAQQQPNSLPQQPTKLEVFDAFLAAAAAAHQAELAAIPAETSAAPVEEPSTPLEMEVAAVLSTFSSSSSSAAADTDDAAPAGAEPVEDEADAMEMD